MGQRWRSWRLGLLLAIELSACRTSPKQSGPPASGSVASPSPPSAELGATERGQLLKEAGRQLEAHYVFAEVGAKMSKAIAEKLAQGGYDAIDTNAELARVVTQDLRDVSHDRHAMLEYKAQGGKRSAEDERRDRLAVQLRQTGGFDPTLRVDGNIAVLTIRSFEPARAVRTIVAQHLSETADADALIVDLRDNSGGDPETVALVASYLFDAPRVHLNDMWWRDDGTTDAFWTDPTAAGNHFGGSKPVFVLTSGQTFSAAEEFAYDLQCLHRATIVGETTKGGAHPVSPRKLSPTLTLRVPTGRSINPVTRSDWEGVGVVPDVQVPAADALAEARARAAKARGAPSGAGNRPRGPS